MNTNQELSTLKVDLRLSRRQFAWRCLSTALLASFAPAITFAQQKSNKKVTLFDLKQVSETTKQALAKQTRSYFQAHLSDYFQTTDGFGTPVSLLLLQINDLPEQTKRLAQGRFSEKELQKQREESFALVFRGPQNIALQQNTYKLRHPVLGEIHIFLVPTGQVKSDDAWRDYEAVFNRTSE